MGRARNILSDGSKGGGVGAGDGGLFEPHRPPMRTSSSCWAATPALWERITSGQVTLNNVVCKTPTADLSLIERTTEAFTLEPETIRALDAKINPLPTTNGTTP